MDDARKKVGPVERITLSLRAGTIPDSMGLTPQPCVFEFIYGIGPKGLSPLEYELADLEVDDIISLRVRTSQLREVLAHLIPADQKEVIKAMADLAQCGNTCCGH